jgi:uncharacterized protein YkwD
MRRPIPVPRRAAAGAGALLALVVALGSAATHPLPVAATPSVPTAAHPAPIAAGYTAASAEASLLAWTNRDRAALGLVPLRADPALADIAGTRADNLAASTTLSHAAAGGDLGPALAAAGVQWYAWGENIAEWPGGLLSTTVAGIYRAWRGSAEHWATLMSPTMNYVGFGVAVRSSDGHAVASTVFTESRDHTAPGARIDSATRSGTTVTFTWHGYDPALQSHWAGLRDFDVWYRVDGGAWRLVRNDTKATSLRLVSRAPGHRYWLKVQARDRAGNVGRMSTPVSVLVP